MPNEHTIAENLRRLVDAKEDISTAITNKGVTVPQGSGLEDFASLITSIPTGTDIDIAKCTKSFSIVSEVYMLNTNIHTIAFGYWEPSTKLENITFTYPPEFTPAFTTPLMAVLQQGTSVYTINNLTCSIDTSNRQVSVKHKNTMTTSSAIRLFIVVFN